MSNVNYVSKNKVELKPASCEELESRLSRISNMSGVRSLTLSENGAVVILFDSNALPVKRGRIIACVMGAQEQQKKLPQLSVV